MSGLLASGFWLLTPDLMIIVSDIHAATDEHYHHLIDIAFLYYVITAFKLQYKTVVQSEVVYFSQSLRAVLLSVLRAREQANGDTKPQLQASGGWMISQRPPRI
jgi:hypothetical protein